MQLSNEFKENMGVLYYLDPIQERVSFNLQTKKYISTPIKKVSCFHNFFRWFVHLITFTLVPRNPELDRVTQNILQETAFINSETKLEEEEKKRLIKSVENLSVVIQNQGGSQQKKIKSLLKTISTIKSLNFPLDMNSQKNLQDEQKKILSDEELSHINDALKEFEDLLGTNAPAHQLIPYLERIPVKKLEEIAIDRLLLLAVEMRKNPDYKDLKEVFLCLVHAIEEKEDEDFLLEHKDQAALLLPFFNQEVQVILIGLILRDGIFNVVKDISTDVFLDEAKKLPLEIWEEASRRVPYFFWDIALLPPAQCAAVVNGQMHNKTLINEFIARYFSSDEIEDQKTCIAYLRSEIFSTKNDFNPKNSSHVAAILSLLVLFTDASKLKQLLAGPFRINYVFQLQPGRGYLNEIFEEFKYHPWKLFFLLDDAEFNHMALGNWLNDEYFFYRYCIQNLTRQQWKEINSQIQAVFNLSENNYFLEALQLYNALPRDIQALFIRFPSLASEEELCQEIPHMCDGEFFIILSEGNSVKNNFMNAFKYGLRTGCLSERLIKRIQSIQVAVMELEMRFQGS